MANLFSPSMSDVSSSRTASEDLAVEEADPVAGFAGDAAAGSGTEDELEIEDAPEAEAETRAGPGADGVCC
ncbi:MAG TPA: hypothetical protein VEI55_00030 [Candidatus Acidoferrum sp.]|nr:hypothetical protein [Candidatus Acidoferrum sp.]